MNYSKMTGGKKIKRGNLWTRTDGIYWSVGKLIVCSSKVIQMDAVMVKAFLQNLGKGCAFWASRVCLRIKRSWSDDEGLKRCLVITFIVITLKAKWIESFSFFSVKTFRMNKTLNLFRYLFVILIFFWDATPYFSQIYKL